ncbi:Transcriptional regulator, AbiEi antitoxin, Type IV TA system [Fibrobacter sp. UWP2]|nr:Transcriptional regulator, AbiEi antitoxin, Type IV TA system [Fibrobacter sp. UWP2]
MNLLLEKGGRITAKQASLAGIHRMILKQLSDVGKIVRVARGVYQLESAQEDELLNLQHRCPTGVFSCETALFLHSLTERAPFMWTMTFKGFYHSPSLAKNGIVVKHSSKNLYPLEIVEVKTPLGNVVRAYSAERTLCEIMTAKVAADIQTITYAIKTYASRKEKNIPKLLQLAKTFHVEKKLRTYLEVLL